MDYPNNGFDFDDKGWNLELRELSNPERGIYPYHYFYDELFVSHDEKYACLFYTINEYRMGAQAGLIGVFKNKAAPILIANPENQWFDFQGKDSIYFFDDFLVVRKLAYNEDKNLSGTPFAIFDLKRSRFGFIDFDWSSIYYSPVRISDTVFKFHPGSSNGLRNLNSKRDGQEFDISTIKYYPFDKLNQLMEMYFQEKISE